jgi:hypothetical protein
LNNVLDITGAVSAYQLVIFTERIFIFLVGEKSTKLDRNGQEQSKKLTYQGTTLNNGSDGLVCTSSNELFALAAFSYQSPKYVYKINKENGEMQRINGFDVAKITLA